MRKLAWLLSAAMVAALAAPAQAAGFQLSGSIESSMVWRHRGWTDDQGKVFPPGVSADTTLTFNGAFGTAQNGVKAVLELAPIELTRSFDPREPFLPTGQLGIRKAYLEANGQLWENSPPVTARIGTLDVNLSPYIATFSREGLSVSGFTYGPVEAAAFVGRDALDDPWLPPFTVSGARLRLDLTGAARRLAESQGVTWPVSASASLAGINLAGRYALELAGEASPYPGVMVAGAAAVDATGGGPGGPELSLREAPRLMRVDMVADVLPNLSVAAGFRHVDGAFDPRYAARLYDEAGNRIDWLFQNVGERGVVLGVRTVQRGVTVQASLDNYVKDAALHRDAELAAGTHVNGFDLAAMSRFDLARGLVRKETKLAVAYPYSMQGLSVTPKYQATIDEAGGIGHELSAQAATDLVPYFPGLKAEGRLARAADGRWSYGAGLSYQAPNGLSVGVHHDSAKGAWVDAGLKVEF